MPDSKQFLVRKSMAILITFVIVWGAVGYVQDGWNQALLFGLVGGPCFALGSIGVLVFLAKRKVRRKGEDAPR